MKNIDYILENSQDAKKAFKVPEGYFDSLTERVMQSIPQEQQNAKVVAMRPRRAWSWAAACACMLIAGATAFLYIDKERSNDRYFENSIASQSDDAVNQAADYVMMDNQDMYLLLAEE